MYVDSCFRKHIKVGNIVQICRSALETLLRSGAKRDHSETVYLQQHQPHKGR